MTFVPLSKKSVTFIDTETTGLLPEKHEIIEFAGVKIWPKDHANSNWRDNQTLHLKILPEHIEDAEPKALEVNGYTPEKWADAIPMSEALPQIVEFLQDTTIGGQNVSFDTEMLEQTIRRRDYRDAKGRYHRIAYHKVDTVTLAFVHLVPLGLERINLVHVCQFLGIEYEKAHTAMADVHATIRVYFKLRQASAWDKFWWVVARKLRNVIQSAVKWSGASLDSITGK